MRNVALQAAWRYDHSILKHVSDALDWIAEKVAILFVALTIILAVILLFKLAVAALAFFVGATVAKFLVGVAVAYFLISQGIEAYKKRIEEGASPVGAFFGALGEVTGVLPVYRALTDSSLSIADRGVQLGFGVLSLFGTAMAAGRLFRAVKLRFPAKITDPRIPVAAEPPPPPQVVAQPKPEFTVRGFLSHKQPPEPAPVQSPATTSPSTGGYARPPGERVPITMEAPQAGVQPKPEFTVRGFLSHKAPPEPAPVQSPATTSPSTGGYARPPGERVPITQEAPPPKVAGPQPTAPREVPSPAPNLQGAQGARASGSVSTGSPRGSQPVRGKSEGATQQAEVASKPTVNAEVVKPPAAVTRAPAVPPRRPGIVNRTLQKLYLSLRMAFDEVLPSHSDIAGGRIGKTPSRPGLSPKAPVEGRPVIIDPANAPTPPAISPAPRTGAVANAPKPSPTAVAITEAPKPATSTLGVAATPRAAPAADMPIAVPPVPAPTTEAAQTETSVPQSATESVAAPTATPTTADAPAPAPNPDQGQVQVLANPSKRVFHLPGSYWYRRGVKNAVLMTRADAEAQGFRVAGSPRTPPPSGVYSVERRADGVQIKGWIGERADRAGYEQELPSAAQYGLSQIVGLAAGA